MQKVEAYRVEVAVVTKDEYSREMDKASKAIEDTKKKAKEGAKAQDDLTKSSKDVAKAQDGLTRSTRTASKGVDDVGRSAEQTDKRFQRTTKTIQSFGDKVKALQRAKATVEVAVRDGASRVLDRVRGTWDSFRRNPITRLTVSAVDRAMGILRGIKNTVLSIPTMITIGLSYVGIKNLNAATVGAAMNWERYEVSMEHWLGGNVKQAKELTKWMGEFADITPFSSPELFPALTTAVSMANRDIEKAKKLTKIAADMAALTPGQTPEDAMQALFNASMGNTMRMKMYGIADGVDEIKEAGGFDKWIEKVEKNFSGGAEKLSKTASGIIATLKGYRGSFMRSIGTGFLEPMKPRLDAINLWLADNQDKWGRWKSVAMGHGKDLSEAIFSTLEKSFGYIQSRYLENPDFMNLDLKGKLTFIGSDVKSYLNGTLKPQLMGWWEETGSDVAVEIGKSIGSGIIEGIKIGIKAGGELFTSSWSNVAENYKESGFSEETKKSLLGAGAVTAGAAYLGKKLIYNPAKSVYNTGKSVAGWVGGRGRSRQPISGVPLGGSDTGPRTRSERHNGRTSSIFKMPEWLKGNGKLSSGLKKVPYIGAGVAALSLFNAEKSEMAGIIGALGGGLAGAKGGALAGGAIGSIVPGVGTAIGAGVGGLIGGIGGAVGGSKAGDWFSENWDSIKDGASDSVKWVKDKWGDTTSWFKKSVWTPMSDAAINATNLLVGAWSYAEGALIRIWEPFSESFKRMVWDPISTVWGAASGWFEERVWTPLSAGAEAAGSYIGERFNEARSVVGTTWGAAESWFNETVWSPISIAVGMVGSHIGEKFQEGYSVMTSAWSAAEGWFERNVWSPLKVGASAASSVISEKMDLLKVGAESANNVVSRRVDLVKKGFTTGFDILVKRGSEETGLKPSKEYARGGIARSPHIGLVGEAGVPEAMIPWDGSSRSKALWQQTGEALGMFSGGSSSGNEVAAVGGGGLALNIGDVNIDGGITMSAEEIMNLIMPALYEKIVAALAKR